MRKLAIIQIFGQIVIGTKLGCTDMILRPKCNHHLGTRRDLKIKEGPNIQIICQDHADCFFHNEGMVHHEFIPAHTTINFLYYEQVLKRLRFAMHCKRLNMWKDEWLLHHSDTAHKHAEQRAPCRTTLLCESENFWKMMPSKHIWKIFYHSRIQNNGIGR